MKAWEISRPIAQTETLRRGKPGIGGIASMTMAIPTSGKPGRRPTCTCSAPQIITPTMTVMTSVHDSGMEPIKPYSP